MNNLSPFPPKQISRYLVVAGIVLGVALLITACDSAGTGDKSGAGDAPAAQPVESVAAVTLTDSAEPTDFVVFLPTDGATLVDNRTDALYLALIGIGTVMDTVIYDPDMDGTPWQPTNPASTFTMIPENLFELQEPPKSITITATLVDENIGGLAIDANLDVVANMTSTSDGMPSTINGSASGDFHGSVEQLMTGYLYETDKVHGGAIHAALALNESVGIGWDKAGGPTGINANVAMSGRASLALSVEGDLSETYTPKLRYGHLLVTLKWDPKLSIAITQAMLQDETGQALDAYLDSIKLTSPTLTIDVYQSAGTATATATYNYTLDELTDLLAF